ncbi:MAG: VTT domain-containing protein [Methanobacteriaceae archaeon]|jgi:membrane protein DedA with SNARE-associated domain|nr:VTT domain-containing protein [Methanobacteriaceae archaeon]MDO9627184.1 VTT domain-containing protein [Methanobacteriaceae archaeon]
MINELFLSLKSFFVSYGALGVFLGSLLEEIIAPIPSAIVVMGSSFLIMGTDPLNISSFIKLFLNVSIPASLGLTIGSLLLYGLGYYLGKPFIVKWGKYLGLSWADVEKTQKKFAESKSDDIILFTLRAIPLVPSVAISTFCGFIRFNLKDYIIITFLGSLVRASALGFIGWQFGIAYKQLAEQISNLEQIVVMGIIILVIGYLIYIKYLKNKKSF